MSEHTNPADQKPPSVDRLSVLWRRINDHKMVQWSVAYVALAYGIQHGVELTSDAFEWPHAVVRISMLLLVLGLPLVMTLAWYHGQRASRRISGPELTIISLLLVGISFLFYVFARPAEEVAAGPKPAIQQTSVAASPVSSAQAGAISLAVLPFVNLSGDVGQEFFSDGMTEEITSALAKVQNLRVVARTSAFQFKGEKKDMRAIGQALGARYLIDGSVRKAGNRVRITAQLIRADSGVNVWSDSYDRELTDVFAIQEEIATAIAAALRVPLGLAQGETLVGSRTKDETSYEDYLRAKALVRSRAFGQGQAQLAEAARLLENVIAREPGFAPALALLAYDYSVTPTFNPAFVSGAIEQVRPIVASLLTKAETAARRAIELDPKNSDAYMALGYVAYTHGKFGAAEDLYKQGFSLDPNNPDGLHAYSSLLADAGNFKQAIAIRERLQALEPLVPIFRTVAARILLANGQPDAALATLGDLSSTSRPAIYAAQGRYEEAADVILTQKSFYLPGTAEAAVRLLRMAPAPVASPQTLPRLGVFSYVYPYIGAQDRVLDWYEDIMKIRYVGAGSILVLWGPQYQDIRKTLRFKAYLRDVGLVDYWRARGWPDLCHPVGTDDFVCS